MFAITIELLAGRYVATAYNDRDRVEWPPHPARLFSALVATWAEGEPASADGEVEVQALRWLERQPAPTIFASVVSEQERRTVAPMFVPVNDVSLVSEPSREKLDAAEVTLRDAADDKTRAKAQKDVDKLRQKLLDDTAKAIAAPTKSNKGDVAAVDALLLERRTKQPRTFPSVAPQHPVIGFAWNDSTVPDELAPGMARLLARLVRLGHSSTLVHAALAPASAIEALSMTTERYTEDEAGGTEVIRWVMPGQVERLGRAFDLHRETEPRVLPARFVAYRRGKVPTSTRAPRGVLSGDFIVFARVDGPRLPSTAAVGVARQLRRALMAAAPQPVAEIISGHAADSSPATKGHIAIIPLVHVTGSHPDGSIQGIAIALPTSCTAEERSAVIKAIGHLERENGGVRGEPAIIPLKLGEAGVLELQRIDIGGDGRSTLRRGTWSRPSRTWATATPVALDRHPGDLHDPDHTKRAAAFAAATASIKAALQTFGLPEPIDVDVVRSCALPGTAKPRTFPRFPANTDRLQRVLVHVRLVFAEPIAGPVLLGAGRFHGLGLFLPVDNQEVGA